MADGNGPPADPETAIAVIWERIKHLAKKAEGCVSQTEFFYVKWIVIGFAGTALSLVAYKLLGGIGLQK